MILVLTPSYERDLKIHLADKLTIDPVVRIDTEPGTGVFAVGDDPRKYTINGVDRHGKANPGNRPDGLKIAVFTPINRPVLSTSRPPDLSGLMEASV